MIAWLVETLIATSGLILLVLILRDPVRRTFGAKVAYALWLLPALRMVMPPMASLIPHSSPIADIAPAAGPVSQFIRAQVLSFETAPVMSQDADSGFSWALVVAGLWLFGALAFALWQILSYQLFRRRILAGARVRRSPAKGIKLLASPRAKGPMAFGIMRRVVVFPYDALMRFDVEEHAMALAHELAHHRRGDLLANAFALGFLAMHWWNPIAWYAHRAFRADQEMACDADVIDAIRDRGLGHAYGRALVKCASGREFSAICHLTTVDRLKRRLSMLSKQSPSVRRRMAGLALTGAVVFSGLALTASGQGMAAQVGAKVSEAMPIPHTQSLLHSLSAMAPSMTPAMAAVVEDQQQAENDARRAQADADRVEADAARMEAEAARFDAEAARAEAEALRFPVPPAPPAPPAPPSFAQVPPAPPAPAMAPLPPVPPAPPEPPAGISRHRYSVHYGDYARNIPTKTEIDAMVPIIEVTEGKGCTGRQQFVNTSVTTIAVDGRARKKIKIEICGKDLGRAARAQALQGLQEARNDIATEAYLSPRMRDKVTADLDREIAGQQAKTD